MYEVAFLLVSGRWCPTRRLKSPLSNDITDSRLLVSIALFFWARSFLAVAVLAAGLNFINVAYHVEV